MNTLISIASLGGNLLLNIGPDGYGRIRYEETSCLDQVGRWMNEYGHIIYGSSRSGLHPSWGRVIRKDEGRRTVLYLCVDKWPEDGKLALDGKWKARKASVLQDGSRLSVRQDKDVLVLNVPATAPDVLLPGTPVIIKLELSGLLPVERLSTNSAKQLGNLGIEE